MIMWLCDRDVADIIALDLAPERLERALALGARAALKPADINLSEEIGKLHGTEICMHKPAVGTDVFIDAAGRPTVVSDVITALPRLKDKIASMISHRMQFEQVLEGLRTAGTPHSAKVMIEF